MTRQQRHLHLALWLGLAPVLAVVIYVTAQAHTADIVRPEADDARQFARMAGLIAFALLSLTMLIGPLSRISARFKPFIRGRRYLGLLTFMTASAHVFLAHVRDNTEGGLERRAQDLFQSNPNYPAFSGFPFESLGVIAFAILCLLVATSHNLANRWLGARVWKALHFLVYFAYALLVAHIAFGVVQLGKPFIYLTLLAIGAGVVTGLHIFTGLASLKRPSRLSPDGWILVARTKDMPGARAVRIKPPKGEVIAVFCEADKVWAVAHNCPHQGGPLGEGLISGGLITCPCHGFQYDAGDGSAAKKRRRPLATYPTKIVAGRVYVYPAANALGTSTPPSLIPQSPQTEVYG